VRSLVASRTMPACPPARRGRMLSREEIRAERRCRQCTFLTVAPTHSFSSLVCLLPRACHACLDNLLPPRMRQGRRRARAGTEAGGAGAQPGRQGGAVRRCASAGARFQVKAQAGVVAVKGSVAGACRWEVVERVGNRGEA